MPIDFQGQDVDDTDLIGKRQGKGGNLDELSNFFRRLTCVVTAKIHLPKNERSPFVGQMPIIFNTIFWTMKLRMRSSIDSFLFPIRDQILVLRNSVSLARPRSSTFLP